MTAALTGLISFLVPLLTILGLAFLQNTSFSIVSRSRNRNNMKYHLIAAFFSNTIWFLTFRMLVRGDMNAILFIPYCIGTMLGSVFGVKISMWIESKLGAGADSHLNKITTKDLADYWYYLQAPRPLGQCGMYFDEWFEKKHLMCPGCKINLLDSHRGLCSDCGSQHSSLDGE